MPLLGSRLVFVLSKWLSRLIVGYFVVKSLLSGIYGRTPHGCLCRGPAVPGRWGVGPDVAPSLVGFLPPPGERPPSGMGWLPPAPQGLGSLKGAARV